MGMINCPNCGETISDKAAACPRCGSNVPKGNMIVCGECKTEYEYALPACPKCGCPRQRVEVKAQKKKHTGVTAAVIAAVLIVVAVLGYVIFQKVRESVYYNNMETAAYGMLECSIKAENAGNLILDVWYNAIYNIRDDETDKYTMKDGKFVNDFNDALANLYNDESFGNSIAEIAYMQSLVTELMKDLVNPPKKYEAACSALKDYYDNFIKLTDLVMYCEGSYNSVSEDFEKYDTDALDSYKKLKLYLK